MKPPTGDATQKTEKARAFPSSNASSRVLLSASAPANNRTDLSFSQLEKIIWGWGKTLVPCREPQVIAGLKWM
jgi:hypothetical protein